MFEFVDCTLFRCEDLDPIRLAPRAVAAVRWKHESRDRAIKVRFAPRESGAPVQDEDDVGLEWYWTEAIPAGHIG